MVPNSLRKLPVLLHIWPLIQLQPFLNVVLTFVLSFVVYCAPVVNEDQKYQEYTALSKQVATVNHNLVHIFLRLHYFLNCSSQSDERNEVYRDDSSSDNIENCTSDKHNGYFCERIFESSLDLVPRLC